MIKLAKQTKVSMNFSKLLEEVYKFDLQKFSENLWENVTFGEQFETEEEQEEYCNRYMKKLENFLLDKVKNDFIFFDKFYQEEFTDHRITDNGKLDIIIDYPNDTITFSGNIDKFSVYCVECINGYGIFHYDSIQDFHDSIPANTEEEKLQNCVDHIHWFSHFEEIYGTSQGAFSKRGIDRQLEHLDSYL